MNKQLLSLALALALVGSSFCSVQSITEQQKIAHFKEVVTAATEAATNIYPDRGWKTAAACGLGASAMGFIGALTATKTAYNAGVRNILRQAFTAPLITAAFTGGSLGHAAIFAPYLAWKQSRQNKKNILILEKIVEHCAEQPEIIPATLAETIAPLVTHYTEHKKLPENINPHQTLTALTATLHGDLYQQAHTAAQAAYPEISKKKAIPLCSGITLAAGIAFDKLANICFPPTNPYDPRTNQIPYKIAVQLGYASSGPISFALYEKFLQHRKTKKSRLIIEHLVKHFAQHPDELTDNQKVVFAPLIAELNEKKSLNIKNPQDLLAQIQTVL